MSYVVRSIVVAQPGRRDELARLMKEFVSEMWGSMGGTASRVLTASIGPTDSMVISEVEHATIADFEQGLAKVNGSEKMAKYGPKFGELTIPGSHRFEIFRIVK